MSDTVPTGNANRLPSPGGRVEDVCDRFKAAWTAGRRPPIEDLLREVPEAGQRVLFHELLVLELAHRRQNGERPTPEEYQRRFPALIDVIETVLEQSLGALGSVRGDLERDADPELQTRLTRAPRTQERAVQDATAPHTHLAGTPTAAGVRFRILRLHRTGGLGAVYVARDEELHREVALKEIRDRHAHDPDSRSRFLQEAEITGRLEHPGIIPVYGLGTYADGRPFYAMRFIKGDNLKDAIARFHKTDVPGRDPERALALRELLGRFLAVCNAMAYAHSRGILHRDIKPDNILLGPYGETLVVDWGLAKLVGRPDEPSGTEEGTLRPDSAGSGNPTRPGDTPGTPAYMSPEQAAGDVDRIGRASDVYSLGATLYCLVTGKPPFEGLYPFVVLEKVRRGEFPRPRQVNRAIDPALEAICLKAMALSPECRYASPAALAEDLDRWLADEPVGALREPWSVRTRRWTGRHGHQVAISFLLLLLMAVAGGTTAWNLNERKNTEIATREAAQKTTLATMATREADSQRYHAILNRVRANRGRLGWTRTGLEDIRRAAELDTTSKDLLELRTEAADCLMAVDVRQSTVLAEGFNVGRLAFSPDGKVIAVADKQANALFSGRVLLIDANTFSVLKTLKYTELSDLRGIIRPNGPERVACLAFSPDGRRLAMGMRHGRVWLWEWDQPNPLHLVWGAHQKLTQSLVFDRDGKTLWTGSADAVVKRWDLAAGMRETPKEVAAFDLNNVNPGNAGARDLVLGQGTLWVSFGWGETETVATLDPQTLLPDLAQVKRNGSLRLGDRLSQSPDRQTLAGATKNMVRLMDAQNSERFRDLVDTSIDISHDLDGAHDHQALQFSPDGSLLASCLGRDGYVGLWDVAAARILARIPMLNQSDCNSAFSPDGRYLAVPDEQRVVLYEIVGRDIARTAAQNCSWVSDFDWSPDGRSLAWIADNGRQFEVTVAPVFRRGEPVRKCFPKSGITPDGPHIASHPEGSVVAFYTTSDTYLWDYGRGDAPTRIAAGFVGPLAFSPDGLRLWGVASKGCVDSWTLSPAVRATHWADTSGTLLGLIENSRLTKLEAVSGFEGLSGLTADARWVLAAGKDGRTRALDARDGTLQAMWDNGVDFLIDPGLDPVRSVALSPDGILGASGMRSGRIWLRRVPDGEEVAALDKHQGAVDALAFQPQGRLLASGSRDGTIRLWRPFRKTWAEVLALRPPGGHVRRLRFSPDGTKLAVLVRNETAVRVWDLASLRKRLTAMGLDWDEGDRPVPDGRQDF